MWKDKFSFLTGMVAAASFGFVAMSDDSNDAQEFQFSQLVYWQQGKWGNSGQVRFTMVAISICTFPTKQVVAIGPGGEAYFAGNGDLHEEKISSGTDIPAERGILRGVRGIGGKAYVVGMHRQVYRRDGLNLWTCIDKDIRPAVGQVLGFESIDGFGSEEIYAVGWEGEIWRFDGEKWHQVNSPTNFILTDVCCAGDGQVYACGRVGMLLVGRNDLWRVIEHESMIEDIWSLAWFKGFLYLATYRGLFRLTDDRLELVDMGEDWPTTFYKVSANADVLWSIGARDIMAFDGNSWSRIE